MWGIGFVVSNGTIFRNPVFTQIEFDGIYFIELNGQRSKLLGTCYGKMKRGDCILVESL